MVGFSIGFPVGVAIAGLLIWYWQHPKAMAEANNPSGLAVAQVFAEGEAGLFWPSGIYRFRYWQESDGIENNSIVRLRERTAKTAEVRWLDFKAYGFLDGYLELVWDEDRWRRPTEEDLKQFK